MASDEKIDLTENNGLALVGTAVVFVVISWIAIFLRTYTRIFLMKGYQADDWLMLVGQIIFTLSCVFILLGVRDGIGRHNEAVTDDHKKVAALMWQALATATYVLDMMFIKLSIGVFLLRLSAQKVYTWILRVSLVIITVWSSVIFFWDIFQCNPVAKQWDYRITSGYCVTADQIVAAAYSISVMTIVSDWLYALLPIPMLWKVKMTTQAKATVIVILGLGIFASVATLIRLRFLADLTDTDDILFAGTDAMVWTLVEPGVAIVASSLATIRPLLRAMRIKGFTSTDNTYGTGRSGTMRSGGMKSRSGTLPGFGPNDVSLLNAPTTFEMTGKIQPSSHATAYSPRNKGFGDMTIPPGRPTGKNEIYMIKSHEVTSEPNWNDRASSSPAGSVEQMHDIEAQSQDRELWPR